MTNLAGPKNYSKVRTVKISTAREPDTARKSRYEVFATGQNVPAKEEIDRYDNEVFHFLAYYENVPCGATRWRFTENGVIWRA